jgi:ABC-2 type transport system permease protein
MVNWHSKKLGDLLLLANGVVLVLLINLLASQFFFRADLTEEQRYSIKQPTRDLLRAINDEVHVEIYLTGNLNPGFERFRKAIAETLEEFRIYSGNKVQYTFADPAAATSEKARNEFMAELARKGIQPTNVVDTRDGQRSEKILFPGVLIASGGRELGITLLKDNKSRTPDEKINQSIESIEFELVNAIHKLTAEDRKRVGLVHGHGELDSLSIAAFNSALLEAYDVFHVDLASSARLATYDALVIAKPRHAYSPTDQYNLDQYILNGGRVLFLLDKLEATMDSASRNDYFAFPYQTNLDDQLFRYGIRINPDLVQDLTSGVYPVVTGNTGGKPRMQLLEWPFFPLINHYADHPITRNLDAVITRFTSTVDTVKATGIKKTPLMFTSQRSRILITPVRVSVEELRENPAPETFTASLLPVAYLLEGPFTSVFKNRFLPEGVDQAKFKTDGVPAKLIVIADGDLAANVVNPRTGQPQELGFDPFTQYTFANRDLLMNAMAYLTDENGLILTRNKEVKIRPLDREKIKNERLTWQLINIALPLAVLVGYGLLRAYRRKRKYAGF